MLENLPTRISGLFAREGHARVRQRATCALLDGRICRDDGADTERGRARVHDVCTRAQTCLWLCAGQQGARHSAPSMPILYPATSSTPSDTLSCRRAVQGFLA